MRLENTIACTKATNTSKNQNGRVSILPTSSKLELTVARRNHITPRRTIPAKIFPKSLRESDISVAGSPIR